MSILRLAPPAAAVRWALFLLALLGPVATAAAMAQVRTEGLESPAGQVVDPSAESAAATTQAAAEPTLAEVVFIAAWLVVAMGLAAATGVFRPGTILGPPRVPPDKPVWPLFLVLVIAAAVFIGAQVVYIAYLQVRQAAAGDGPPRPIDLEQIGPGDFAILATIPFILGFAALVLGNKTLGRLSSPHFGLDARFAAAGVGKGVVGFVIAMPVVLAVTIGMQWFYQAIGYEHPTEHELLTVLRETGRGDVSFWALIFGATVLAPLAEEAMFRGQMQTMLTALFSPKRRRPTPGPAPVPVLAVEPVPAGATVEMPSATYAGPDAFGTSPVPPPLPPPPPTYGSTSPEPPPSRRAAWQPWLAIAITALIFAVFHPAWTIPAIFVLAACLGYAYERTANLYVPITMHLLFNSMQTAMFLMAQKPA